MPMSPKPRTIAGGVAAAVLGSGVTAALLLGPNPTGAAAPPSTEPTDTEATDDGTDQAQEPSIADEALREAIQPLVDNGVLTDEQADDLVEELLKAGALRFDLEVGPHIRMVPGFPAEPGVPGFPELPGGRHEGGPFGGRLRVLDGDVIADAIGIDETELRQQLAEGATVAEIAEANGVEPQAVIDALVADYTERITDWINGEGQASNDETGSTEGTTQTTEVEA
jgi:hypothetical protein